MIEKCNICKSPIGFCKHSVDIELSEYFPPDDCDIYALRKLFAKLCLECQTLTYTITRLNIENNSLHNEINLLNEKINVFRKKMKSEDDKRCFQE